MASYLQRFGYNEEKNEDSSDEHMYSMRDDRYSLMPFSVGMGLGGLFRYRERRRDEYGHRQHQGSKHQNKSSHQGSNNFIGLRNRGNTCYVNSS